jgi:hypothetical protein
MMGGLLKILIKLGKAIFGKGGKAKPKTPPKTTPPGCKGGCAKLPKVAKKPSKRHDPCKTSGSDPTKEQNSMADPSINMADDVAAMNAGNFTRAGEDIVVNGRTYGWHPETGTTFPKSGPGIVQMDRGQHQLLKQLNSQPLANAMKFAEKFPGLTKDKVDAVMKLWSKCK